MAAYVKPASAAFLKQSSGVSLLPILLENIYLIPLFSM
jgi:hypothetical protein